MHLYLPIAEVSVNVFVLLGLGGGVGFLSGLFGVGGGFLMTPLLILIGISPAVAVGTGACQVVAASVSGAIAHWRRRNVDIKMGLVLLAGGFVGSTIGVWVFKFLRSAGQIDLTVSLLYVILLGVLGVLMLQESLRTMFKRRRAKLVARKLHQHTFLHGLPFKMRFRRSKLYVSALLPLVIGFAVGILAAILGVGGGFLMVPAVIYLVGMPTSMVVGTSLFQIVFVTANVTFLQAYQNQTVDIVLALVLIAGGVIGAQIGSRAGTRLRGEELRGLLATMVLIVSCVLAYQLLSPPEELYSLGARVGAHR